MTDDLSLAGLGAAALTEGVKFLYQQATELLARRRIRNTGQEPGVPDVVAQPRTLPAADPGRLATCEPQLAELAEDLRARLPADGSVSAEDGELLRLAEALRQVLSAVYGTPIVFSGEARPSVHGTVDVDEVAGYVAAVRADLAAGKITGATRIRRVEAGAEAYGVDLRPRD